MSQRDHRNVVIGVLCAAILVMGVGFAYLSVPLLINGTATVTNASWDVKFTNIGVNANPTATDASHGIESNGLVANLNVLLTKPGDTVTYTLTISNTGSLDAIVNNVNATTPEGASDAIIFTYDDLETQIIRAGETKTMNVTFTYDANASNASGSQIALAENTTTPLEYTIGFDCVQYVPGPSGA